MAISELLQPSDDRVEMALLGELLRNSSALSVVGSLYPFHFTDPVHGKLFEVIRFRVQVEHPADLVTMLKDLSASHFLEEVGGTAYLSQLAQLPPLRDISGAAERVQDLWLRRQLLVVYEQQRLEAEEGALNAHAISSRASAQLLLQMTIGRCAEWYAACQALMAPPHPVSVGGPADAIKMVSLMPLEVSELAESHDAKAAEDERTGNDSFAERRRERARQLRELIGEPQR